MRSTPVPAHPALGRVVSRHHGRVLAGGLLLYLGFVFGAGAVLAAREGQPAGAAVGAAAALVLFYISYARWHQSVTVYERGLVWSRGARSRTVRWDEVADVDALRVFSSTGTSYRLRAATRTGRRLVLTGAIADIEQVQAYLAAASRSNGRTHGRTNSGSSHA